LISAGGASRRRRLCACAQLLGVGAAQQQGVERLEPGDGVRAFGQDVHELERGAGAPRDGGACTHRRVGGLGEVGRGENSLRWPVHAGALCNARTARAPLARLRVLRP
jgi:hypothetical protein